MRNYVYPKVPNYYHESVPAEFFTADDLVLIEKLDGSNCKVCLYDERYSDLYGDDIHDYDPEDGDVFISSKKRVRGRLSDPLSVFDDVFDRLVVTLREKLDVVSLRASHDKYGSPLVLYGEHMVRHTLDYEYGESPPPAFIGFDVLRMDAHVERPANPFDERFDGFLSLDEAYKVFDTVGLVSSAIVDCEPGRVNPETLEIPESEYAGVQAEGVVLRSDSRSRRVKCVSPEFRERAKDAWGIHESDAQSGVELFEARYLTNARIRKTVNKLLHNRDVNEITPSRVAQAAVADAWEEELADIRRIRVEMVPVDVFDRAEARSEAVIETMQTNAALNDTTLDQLWTEFHGKDVSGDGGVPEVGISGELSSVVRDVRGAESVEDALVRCLVPEPRVHETVESVVAEDEDEREIGRWVTTPVADRLEGAFWYENIGVLAHLPVGFVPSEIQDVIAEYVSETIDARDDVEVDEKPDDWQPSIDNADTSGLGDLF